MTIRQRKPWNRRCQSGSRARRRTEFWNKKKNSSCRCKCSPKLWVARPWPKNSKCSAHSRASNSTWTQDEKYRAWTRTPNCYPPTTCSHTRRISTYSSANCRSHSGRSKTLGNCSSTNSRTCTKNILKSSSRIATCRCSSMTTNSKHIIHCWMEKVQPVYGRVKQTNSRLRQDQSMDRKYKHYLPT